MQRELDAIANRDRVVGILRSKAGKLDQLNETLIEIGAMHQINNEIRECPVVCEAAARILELASLDSMDCVIFVLRAIVLLCNNNFYAGRVNKTYFCAYGGGEAVVELLKEFGTVLEEVAVEAYELFYVLCDRENHRLMCCGGRAAVLDVLHRFGITNVQVAIKGCDIIRKLHVNYFRFYEYSECEAVFKILKTFGPTNHEVARKACKIIYFMCEGSYKNKEIMVSLGIKDVLDTIPDAELKKNVLRGLEYKYFEDSDY